MLTASASFRADHQASETSVQTGLVKKQTADDGPESSLFFRAVIRQSRTAINQLSCLTIWKDSSRVMVLPATLSVTMTEK